MPQFRQRVITTYWLVVIWNIHVLHRDAEESGLDLRQTNTLRFKTRRPEKAEVQDKANEQRTEKLPKVPRSKTTAHCHVVHVKLYVHLMSYYSNHSLLT